MSNGRRVLIVEDEALIAFLLEDMIQELGYEVAGTANSLAAAMDAEPSSYDMAILDVSLNGHNVYPFAVTLAARGTPFAFASGGVAIPPEHGNAPLLHKPFRQESLARILEAMTAA
jgi:DNA-binding response OmpR family regulator